MALRICMSLTRALGNTLLLYDLYDVFKYLIGVFIVKLGLPV